MSSLEVLQPANEDGQPHQLRAPLVLDLDGTLIKTDSLMETMAAYLRANPLFGLFMLAFWLLRGRPHLKRQLAVRARYDMATWPVNQELVDYAKSEAAHGRTVVLATAGDRLIADKIKERFDFISEVFASDGDTNLKSGKKAEAMARRFPQGFVYAGDSRADLKVWAAAAGAIVVGGRGLAESAARRTPIEAQFAKPAASPRVWIRALRIHQWAKNALVFVPLFLGGEATNPEAWLRCILCFIAMGLLASSTYLLNDLVDLETDRGHWSKQHRPLASGALPLARAMGVAPFGLAAGLLIGYWGGGWAGLGLLLVYVALTLSYSFALKRAPILDSVTLAGLFTLRLGMGVVFAQVETSERLFLFSMLLFTSLSLAKRATEIRRMADRGQTTVAGRGYVANDLPTVAGFGAASAVGACLVFSLYIINNASQEHFYARPGFLWVLPVALSLWLGRVWLLCGRGELADDPVAFAVKDRISLALGAATFAAFAIAAIGN